MMPPLRWGRWRVRWQSPLGVGVMASVGVFGAALFWLAVTVGIGLAHLYGV